MVDFPVFLWRVTNIAGLQIEPSPSEKFFGLAARPFSLTPDLRFAYHSRSHTHALEQVTSALRRREGLIVVTGAIGTGKTMLCRSMLENFESRTFLSVILDPGLEVEDLLRKVLTDFGIMSGIDAPASGPISEVTRHQFVSTLQQFLASLIPLRAHAVIMIDEAQRLNPRVLEEVRLLSNFETDEAKLLQIVLVGQPDLDELLRRPDMQQLNQRVARRCELQPLTESEVGDYIERRLTVAASPAALAGGVDPGIGDTALVARFSGPAVRTVAGISGGIPRLVNTLCDRALEVAYERQLRVIDPDAVMTAAERLQLDIPSGTGRSRASKAPMIAAALAVLALLAFGLWWYLARSGNTTAPPSPPTSSVSPSAGEPAAAADTPAAAATDAAPSTAPGGTPPASGTPAQPGGAADSRATQPVAATDTPAAATAPASSLADATPRDAAGSYQIAIAAFKTESRAQDVAAAVTAMQIPARVRPDPAGVWFRVVAGPFSTREAGLAAQDVLTRGGYTGTRLSQVSAEPR
jgi:general secretion pathway protein A